MTTKIDKAAFKVSNFEDQTRFSTKGSNSNKNYFEKKRLSDNTVKNDDRYKIEDDAMREIFDKKEKNRKGHNISVTTNNSTNSTTTNAKKTNYG